MRVKRKSDFVIIGQDIKDDAMIMILDEGEEGQFGYVFRVQLPNADTKKMRINNLSLSKLIQAWGDETEKWVGKAAKVKVMETFAFGKEIKYVVLTPES